METVPFPVQARRRAPPCLAAPFQLRLDWQMWFPALSDCHSAQWLVHLVAKLLADSTDAKQLLDASLDPFPLHPPDAIRCHLYYYNFSRLNTLWSHESPTAAFISRANGSISPWWTRTFAREFLPVLELGNSLFLAFVDHHWPPQPPPPRLRALCRPSSGSVRLAKRLCGLLARRSRCMWQCAICWWRVGQVEAAAAPY